MRRIKKGDDVIVITGKDKGKRGSVLNVVSEDLFIVSDVNMVKRHTKPNPNRGISGGIIEKEMPIKASNIMLYNPQTEKGGRIGFKILEDGTKVRYFKAGGEVLDV